MLAAKLSRGFIDEGHIRFTGQSVEGPKDLALLSQVVRNPTYEIHRVDFVKQGKVAGEMLHTSRLTGTTALFGSNKGAKQFIADMSKAKDAYKADGYYLMHNHPSSQSIRRTNAIYYPLYQLN